MKEAKQNFNDGRKIKTIRNADKMIRNLLFEQWVAAKWKIK